MSQASPEAPVAPVESAVTIPVADASKDAGSTRRENSVAGLYLWNRRRNSATSQTSAVGSDPHVDRAPSVIERQHSASVHTVRLARRSYHMIDDRVDDLQHNKLVHEPVTTTPWWKAFVKNLWVLAIITGVLVIILTSVERLHVAEPLSNTYAVEPSIPHFQQLPDDYLTYLFVVNVIAPYYPPGSGTGGHRRLLSFDAPGDTWPRGDGGGGGGRSAAAAAAAATRLDLHGAVDAATTAHVLRLLSRPSRVMGRRRLLGDEDAVGGEESGVMLQVAIMQRNATNTSEPLGALAAAEVADIVVTPQQHGFTPVTPSQQCPTKQGAAVKCSLSFTSNDLTSANQPGQPLYLAFYLNQSGVGQVVFTSHSNELGWLGYAKNWLALAILLGMLIGIATEKVHRMWCAFIAAACMMGLLLWMDMAPDLSLVVSWLDESTLGLLFGMMIIVGRLKNTGVFEILSASTMKLCGGKMWLLTVMMMYITGFVSALLDNVTTMLLMGPITIAMMQTCNKDPVPLLMAQVLMSNIGGAATMVGDPPNIIIGTALSDVIGFVDFIINMAPGALMASIPATGLILWIYKGTLLGPVPAYDKVLEVVREYRITDWDLFAKCTYVTTVVVIGFVLHPVHHLDPAWFAVLGAIVLCVTTNPMDVEEVLHDVEWDMLLFFAGQFVMVEAAAEVGMIDMIGGWLEWIIRAAPPESRELVAIEILLWASAVISGMLDNIPYTITMVPVIEYLASAGLGLNLEVLAWALAFGACFGGNATLIGASANIVTATILERAGYKVTFVGWLKAGVPVTIVTVAVANVWLLLRFVV